MASFLDHHGRTWALALNPHLMKRVREEAGVNLGRLLDDNLKGLSDLLGDPVTFADVLFLLCRNEATKRNMTAADFGESLDGDTMERAADAFLKALADFSPRQARELLLSLADKEKEMRTVAAARGIDLIRSLDVETLLTSKSSPGSSAASAESTPPG